MTSFSNLARWEENSIVKHGKAGLQPTANTVRSEWEGESVDARISKHTTSGVRHQNNGTSGNQWLGPTRAGRGVT